MCKMTFTLRENAAEALRQKELEILTQTLKQLKEPPEKSEEEDDDSYDERLGKWLLDPSRRLRVKFLENWKSTLEYAEIIIEES